MSTTRLSPRSVISWCEAHLRSEQLDRLIADGLPRSAPGIDPATRRLCEARARQLVRRDQRVALALQIERILALAASDAAPGGSRREIWAIDLRLADVRDAGRALEQIAGALRAPESPPARGVARAALLVRDGRSPLYVFSGPHDLRLAAEATVRALTAADDEADGEPPAEG